MIYSNIYIYILYAAKFKLLDMQQQRDEDVIEIIMIIIMIILDTRYYILILERDR